MRGLPNMKRVRVTTTNRGGLGSDLCKERRLVAYLMCAEPHIVRLAELGPVFPLASLHGLPYVAKTWLLFLVNSLAVLLLQHMLPSCKSPGPPVGTLPL